MLALRRPAGGHWPGGQAGEPVGRPPGRQPWSRLAC